MAFAGKPVRQQEEAAKEEGAEVMLKFKQELPHFEQSVKEMQTCLKALYDTVAASPHTESIPRVQELQLALQDQVTVVENFVNKTRDVEEHLEQFFNKCDNKAASAAKSKRSDEFNKSVLLPMFEGQNVFFSESCKVSQVLIDIVSQTKHIPTEQHVQMTTELKVKLDEEPQDLKYRRPPGTKTGTAVSTFATGETHRGVGTLAGGAFGKPPPKGPSMGVKPASRFNTPPSTSSGGKKIYI